MIREQEINAERLAEGMAAHGQGRLDEAAECYQEVLRSDPRHVDALHLSGLVRVHAAAFVAAYPYLKRTIALDPGFAEALNHGALALLRTGYNLDALRLLLRAIAIRRDFAEAHANCGGVLFELAEWRKAIDAYDRALALRPDYAEAHANRANSLQLLGELDEARPAYRRGLVLKPDLAEAHSNLASLDQAEGELIAAVRGFRRALALKPLPWVHSNLLFCLSYDGRVSHEAFFAEFRRWEAMHAKPLYPATSTPIMDRDPQRRLRIGWISADFREHPVARNVIGILEHRDRTRIETVLYASPRAVDPMTDRFRATADAWRDIVGWPDADVARQMRADRLDMLIVLAGHTGHNRLGVAAHRPAPVQVSFHDLATSGLSVMDAWITDRVLHPDATTERFTEQLIRLPCFYLHDPPADAPEIGPLPASVAGRITFGSCNNTAKHTPEVFALWAEVLSAVPDSRLMLKYLNRYASRGLRQRVQRMFASNGVDPARIEFVAGERGRRDQLALLNSVDIALDPFPFNGSTTTFEALWMGVPVVTLAGSRFLSRVGASVLHQVGLDDLVADDRAGYVVRTIALANDRNKLATLRTGLRGRVAASPLCDAPGYARSFWAALRRLWIDRCRRQ
ncbi:MAG: tetratricopeptide repeat protein [Alphaproteobacteria bacterium]|nr:tetratricopeptide repeat protein [Alphaproteobacteria bacterium]